MALPATLTWEVRTTGSSANGGGFNGTALAGTPSAPAVTGSGTGGTVAAGTYYVAITYTPGGETRESPISAQTAVTLSGTTSKFTVTHPSDPGNGAAWNCYVGTASGGPYFPQGTGLVIGSDRVVTATPPTSGTQPPGVDYSRQDSPQLTVDNSTVTATTAGANSNVITFTGYTPTAADVGNVYNSTGGTNVNTGRFHVDSFTSTTWTVSGLTNLTTAGGAGSALLGKMGGAADHPATINSAASVTGMVVFNKYSATPYTFTTSLTNSNAHWVGYDTTRTFNNTDANRPIWRAGANSLTLMTLNGGTFQRLTNIVFDNPSATFTGCSGAWSNGSVLRCQFSDFTGTAGLLLNGNGATAEDCEFLRVTSTGSLYMNAAGNVAIRCVFKSCGYVRMVNDGCTLIRCVAVSATGIAFNSFGGQSHQLIHCVAYGSALNGWAGVSGSGGGVLLEDCIFYGNGATGVAPGLAARNNVRLVNCRAGNNTTADYDTSRLGTDQVVGFVHLTGDPFTNAAGFDFSLNNTAGAGAACKAVTTTLPGGTTTGYPDAGAAQSQAAAGGLIVNQGMAGGLE